MIRWGFLHWAHSVNKVVLLVGRRRWRTNPFVRLIRGLRTAHTEHRGHWCNRDSMTRNRPFSFVLRIKLAIRPVIGTFSVLERGDLPDAGLTALSVLSHYERRGLWYSCTDVALVSSCHGKCDNVQCKRPSGMWQQREIWMISDCISQAWCQNMSLHTLG